ncbi:MAG TPA: alanine racemase [Actinobacteria bacterium]|nr:alanine racemase [Actinomycetota bacterium]
MNNLNHVYYPDDRFAWVEINLDNLDNNLKLIKKFISSSNKDKNNKKPAIMTVVKANAYGHGLLEISKRALASGSSFLGVALIHEGLRLRNGGIKAPIICLGAHSSEKVRDAVENDIHLSVTSVDSAKTISDICSSVNKECRVHIKIDTGMNRIGLNYKDAVKDIIKISEMPGIKVEGAFTHFACASKQEDSYNMLQWNRFSKIMEELKIRCPGISSYHCSNSAAFLRYPRMHLDMVRLGIIVYGINPFNNDYHDFCDRDVIDFIESLQPVLSLKAKISFVKHIPEGESISYCGTFKTRRDSIIATIPVGYADGYSWNFSNKAYAIYNDCFAPVVGNITMDQTMFDITDCNGASEAGIGDEIVLIGRSANKKISVNELADLIETINYEIICMIGDRIPRTYTKGI